MPTVSNHTDNKEETAFLGVARGEGSTAIFGQGSAVGVRGDGTTWHGVAGISVSTTGGAGVYGQNNTGGPGMIGESKTWVGVYGETNAGPDAGACGVLGEGKDGGVGVKGHARAPGKAAVAGFHLANTGPGIYGEGSPAGLFKGNVVVTGNLNVAGDVILDGADYAEEFPTGAEDIEPGMVVVFDDDGRIRPCENDYDMRVAGIVSGAGGIRPALVLDRQADGLAVALLGKVWTMADAGIDPIRPGDLLTSARRRGHARRVDNPSEAFGAVIGRALTPLDRGQGLVRVLVSAAGG